MNGSSFLNKKVLGAFVLVLLLGVGGLAWMERTPLLACYCVHNLARAKEADRAVWVNRVVSIGEPALGDLLDCLNDPADDGCGNARAALEKLTAEWGPGNARTVSLALRCGREFPHMSAAGRRNVLELAVGWFPPTPNEGSNAAGLVPPCSRLLAEAVATKDAAVQAHALELCSALTRQPEGKEARSSARELVRACLTSEQPVVRVRAVQLTLQPGMDLADQVVPLLGDAVAEVRRAALLAVGPACPANEGVLEDVLLPSLHDADAEVRRLCEDALRSRGLTPQKIKLGRLLTHPNPVERSKVFDLLEDAPELDLNVWLLQLSRDASPNIRVAAIRVMSERLNAPPHERIREMAKSDPSASVAWVAQCYLDKLRPR